MNLSDFMPLIDSVQPVRLVVWKGSIKFSTEVTAAQDFYIGLGPLAE